MRPKWQLSKIPDDGRPSFGKWSYLYISATNSPISMKSGAQMHILILRMVMWYTFLKIHNGGLTDHFWLYLSIVVRSSELFPNFRKSIKKHFRKSEVTNFKDCICIETDNILYLTSDKIIFLDHVTPFTTMWPCLNFVTIKAIINSVYILKLPRSQ